MRPRWLLSALLLLICALIGCTRGALPATPTQAPRAAAPAVDLPAGCAPLVQYQSIDSHGASCTAVVCEDGRMVRTSGCSATTKAPEQITQGQLTALRERINESNFFAQEAYYRASADC